MSSPESLVRVGRLTLVCRNDSPKQTVRLPLDPGREEEVVLSSRESSVAEGQPPKTFDSDRRPVAPRHLAQECTRRGIKRINATITKIADKQVVAQLPEMGGGENDTPRSIELPPEAKV